MLWFWQKRNVFKSKIRLIGWNKVFFFTRLDSLQTFDEKEKNRIEEKKFAIVANVFGGHACSTDSTGHIRKTSEPQEKKHANRTNRHILEQMNREEKKTKLLVSRLK